MQATTTTTSTTTSTSHAELARLHESKRELVASLQRATNGSLVGTQWWTDRIAELAWTDKAMARIVARLA